MDKKLFIQAITKFIVGFIIIALLLFIPAGTLNYWNGWVFICILFVPMFIVGIILMIKSPDLLRKRLNSKEELLSLYENVKDLLTLRDKESESTEKYYISVCGGTGCNSSSSPEIVSELKRWAKECGVEDKVEIAIAGCFGFCERGPIVKIFPDHTFYTKVKPSDAERIINMSSSTAGVVSNISAISI